MCEFNIIIEGEKVYGDVVYAKHEENEVILKTILGEIKKIQNCRIIEVDVNNAKLVLEKIK